MNFDDLDDQQEDLGPDRNLGIEAGLGLDTGKGGAAKRYKARIPKFVEDGRPLPKLRHHALWLLHNLVAHPLLAVLPNARIVAFHERTSAWLNHQEKAVSHQPSANSPGGESKLASRAARRPEIRHRTSWIFHNLVAHLAIGLFPCAASFRIHDWSAKKMAVPGWV
jgi:hypothetical protein